MKKINETLRPQLKVLFPEIHTLALQKQYRHALIRLPQKNMLLHLSGYIIKSVWKKQKWRNFQNGLKLTFPSDSIRIITTIE